MIIHCSKTVVQIVQKCATFSVKIFGIVFRNSASKSKISKSNLGSQTRHFKNTRIKYSIYFGSRWRTTNKTAAPRFFKVLFAKQVTLTSLENAKVEYLNLQVT